MYIKENLLATLWRTDTGQARWGAKRPFQRHARAAEVWRQLKGRKTGDALQIESTRYGTG